MDLQDLDQLIDLFLSKDLLEMEVEENGRRVRLRRPGPAAPTTSESVSAAEKLVGNVAPKALLDIDPQLDSQYVSVDAPMVGTFYRAPAPDAKSFVEEGQEVDKNQTLCILEAMKVMNEIECEFRARIVSILVENGQPVEFGERLFLVEPL